MRYQNKPQKIWHYSLNEHSGIFFENVTLYQQMFPVWCRSKKFVGSCTFVFLHLKHIYFIIFSKFILFEILYRFCFYTFILLYYLIKLKIENHHSKINALFLYYLYYFLLYIIFYISYISRYREFTNQLTYQYILIFHIFNNFYIFTYNIIFNTLRLMKFNIRN